MTALAADSPISSSMKEGQLIFKRAYLFPARMSFEVRATKIN